MNRIDGKGVEASNASARSRSRLDASAHTKTDCGDGSPRCQPQVSFIIPAFNSEHSIARTLESLKRQTFHNWEAIVVDDGSLDGTAKLVETFRSTDARIRLVSQTNAGVSAARNAGIALARGRWLVFLDSDDWISRRYLSGMFAALKCDQDAAVACCGFARTNPTGDEVLLKCVPDFRGNPFASFARQAMGTIHSFMVLRSLVREVGGFDPELRACEDWDLYQRVFRTGARLVQTPEILAFYVNRSGSLSRDGGRMIADARIVFLRGCTFDSRVPEPDPRYAHGVNQSRSVEYTCLWLACWCTATAIGCGHLGTELLDGVRDFSDFDDIGQAIHEGLVIGSNVTPGKLVTRWPLLADHVTNLIDEIALRSEDV